jgi:excisionase family DNA binding protein
MIHGQASPSGPSADMHRKQTTSRKSAPHTHAGANASDHGRTALGEGLLTASEVARMLRLSRSEVYGLVRGGGLPSLRIGRLVRFIPAAVRRYIQKHSEPPRQSSPASSWR